MIVHSTLEASFNDKLHESSNENAIISFSLQKIDLNSRQKLHKFEIST
eukprot:UN07145